MRYKFSYIPIAAGAIAVLLLLFAFQSYTSPPSAQLPSGGETMSNNAFQTIVQDYGAVNNYPNPESTEYTGAVVSTKTEWEQLWGQIHGEEAPPLPEVGFSSHYVVGAFSPLRGSGGYALQIDRVAEGVVYVSESCPPKESMQSAVLTRPFHLVAVEGRPPARVRFDFSRTGCK